MDQKEFVNVKGRLELTLRNIHTGEEDIQYVPNLVTKAGVNAMAQALRGNYASDVGTITYCAVGTSAVAPVNTNTQLGGELARKLISVRSVDAADLNTAVFEIFFNTSEANGTLREAGLFGGTANTGANTGTLFCHSAINRTKTSSDTLSIRWYVTIGTGL